MDKYQVALGAEIRAEAARQRITAKALQEAAGIGSSSWANYFVQCTRDAPMAVIVAVAEELGLKGSELLAKAEARVAADSPVGAPIPKEIADMMSKGAQKVERQPQRPARKGSTVRRTGS